ncbi:quinone oxidoreductase family protein [Sphingomonas crocodyli]|uniref:Enoyl reductase (ER) domain-containing protein n=1 Tax=Sphingomonas crocodyli TaxID=1979270 RepID=A0A437M5J1_9SPHN|nr:zinc-binding dehydrogenase [Sphingomonas crocodyli]RVT92958.1 hypothetical protein EOD43_03355 [Sphingomonas crocodyli]
MADLYRAGRAMRIVRLDEIGPPENLRIVEEDIPSPGPGELLVRTALAGMIYGDMEARRGTYFKPTRLPFYPGREVAGEIVAVGDQVTSYAPSDRIMALVLTGRCWADYAVISTKPTILDDGRSFPPDDIIRLPAVTSYADALPYLINFRLAHLLFHGSSRVPRGSTVLIHGASGGMGSMMSQLARAHDCEVIATCISDAEADYCRTVGANHVIIASHQDYVSECQRITNGAGISFSFNGVGGDTLNRDFDVLAPFGELHAYGYVAGKIPFEAFRLGKTISLKTFSADDYLATPMFADATLAMMEWLEHQPLKGVDLVLPLEAVVEANRLLDAGKVRGKLALAP